MLLSLTTDLDATVARVLRLGELPLVRAYAEQVEEQAREAFARETAPDGSAWAQLDPDTIERKGRSGILEETGALARSVESVLLGDDAAEIGSPLGYAGLVNDGTRYMPRRRFLDGRIDEAEWSRIVHRLAEEALR